MVGPIQKHIGEEVIQMAFFGDDGSYVDESIFGDDGS